MTAGTPAPSRPAFRRALGIVFGSTVAVQALAFLRQVAIAAVFGVGAAMDAYAAVLTVATISVFALASLMDTVAVPRLARLHDTDRNAFAALAGRLLGLSALSGTVLSLVFVAAAPAMGWFLSGGLGPDAPSRLLALAPSFLPWTLVAAPYYALGSVLKAQSRFGRVFAAEIAVVVVSLGAILVAPAAIAALPLAYGLGYAVGLCVLWTGVRIAPRWPAPSAPNMRDLLRNAAELFATGQIASLGGLAERFFLARLPTGALGAWLYSSLIVTSTATLLTFRETFIVPLAAPEGRREKLGRLLVGLTLLAIPAAAAMVVLAEPIVRVLFGRGRFDAAAVALTADVLRGQALALWPSMICAPLLRMFQILDRIRLGGIAGLTNVVALVVFGTLLGPVLGFGPFGFGLAWAGASAATAIVAFLLLATLGAAPALAPMALHGAWALAVCVLGAVLAGMVPAQANAFLDLVAQGAALSAPVAIAYGVMAPRLRRLLLP